MKTERRKLKDKLDVICREIIRIRDDNRCQRCHKPVEKSNAHCSHVIPKSRGDTLRWDLINLKLLCFHCHINKWHKDPMEAYEWFAKAFPARWRYLESRRHTSVKFTIQDLKDLRDELKLKLKQLKGM